mgnify:CR=1 FL=1
MNSKNDKRTFEFDVINWENGTVKIPDNILNELDKNSSLHIIISEATDQLLKKYDIDENLFYAIRNVQDIPDNVVINFILSESSLSQDKFKL